MKKFLTLLLVISIITSTTFAQAKKETSTTKPGQKIEMKKVETKKEVSPMKESKKVDDSKMKKDGTPDMRFKENKVDKKADAPKKADGTPDMRFKENKKDKKDKKNKKE